MGRSIAKTRKRNKATKAARAAYARRILQKKQAGDRFPFQRHAGPTLPETATVHILTEPLLEIFKEEPQLEVVESLPEICTNPTGSDSIPKVPLFCALCLRPCTSDQLVEFSTEPSGREKLALPLGVDIELEQCAICRSCWIMVETFADFQEGCLKASVWRERFPFGLDGAGDDWLSKENLEVMTRTRIVVQEHVARIKNARNMHELISEEIPEEKPMLADNQHSEEDVNYLLLSEEPPNDKTAQILDQTGNTSFSCEKCQRMFETKLGIALHLRRCTKSSKTKQKLYTCSICSMNFTKSYRLREHRNKHMGIKPYECRSKNCNKRFHATHERCNHERKCEGIKSLGLGNHTIKCDEPGIKPLKCKNEGCARHFYGNSELQRHAANCSKRNKPVCPLCGIQLASTKTLKAHMKIHEKRNYTCNDCDKAFSSAHLLNVHRQQIHTQEKGFISFICAFCGQEFEYSLLVQHMEKCHAGQD